MKKYPFFLFIISLMISACSSGSNSPSIVGTWRLTAYGSEKSPAPAVSDADAFITFNPDETLSGNGGCNGLGGDFTVKGDQITFGPIMSTMMACEEPRMTQEGTVTQVMSESASYKIEGNTLTIRKDGNVLIFESVAEK